MATIEVIKDGNTRIIEESQLPGFEESGFTVVGPSSEPLGSIEAPPKLQPPPPPKDVSSQQYEDAWKFAHPGEQFPGLDEGTPATIVDSESAEEEVARISDELDEWLTVRLDDGSTTRMTEDQYRKYRQRKEYQEQIDIGDEYPTVASQVGPDLTPLEKLYREQTRQLDQDLDMFLVMLDDRMDLLDARNQRTIGSIQAM